MAAAPAAFTDIMDDNASFTTILTEFGLSARAKTRFTEDFTTLS